MKLAVIAVLGVCLFSGSALADEPQPESRPSTFNASYLIDGGALPFFWGALAGRLALDNFTNPSESPRFFSEGEGGAARADWEIPGYAVSGLGVGLGVVMLSSGDDSRMYHIKGLAESLMTGVTITGGIKVLVGRHRPDWGTDGYETQGSRRSFPSGHATQAFAIATYSVLFLRQHVFSEMRGNSRLPWWEAATYAGIALSATALAGERVMHNRHHLSDVVIGGALGTLSSTLFYLYQENRYQNHRAREARKSLQISPTISNGGTSIGVSGVF
ncbi:MAG: phosphatase PAP2 family protein [Deltaproteobacteria bacterium]|nr:phosphatase PAP2 family protein [Deltaproteobacteria bacterium]